MEQLQKKVMRQEKKDLIKRGLLGISIPLISMSYPLLNQYRGNTNTVFIFVDNLIPFNRFFILPLCILVYIYSCFFCCFMCSR